MQLQTPQGTMCFPGQTEMLVTHAFLDFSQFWTTENNNLCLHAKNFLIP